MNFVEATKTFSQLDKTIATSATHAPVIDTIGFGHASIDVVFEKVAAAGTSSVVANVLKVQQGDGTTYTDITALVGGGAGGFTIPTPPNTTADNVIRFDIDLKGQRGRYLRVQATPQAANSVYTVVRLSKGEQLPDTAASKGALRTVSTSLGLNLAPDISYVN